MRQGIKSDEEEEFSSSYILAFEFGCVLCALRRFKVG